MGDLCTDNRFELIEKYKQKLIECTNIESAPDEMAVLDNILFRFWQMGWLDKLDLPSAELEMGNLISRQAAIDALARAAREKFNLSDEFDHYLAGLIDGEDAIRQLPSADVPEIIRCKDCKWFNDIGCSIAIADDSDRPTENDFCSFAERRTDE